MQRTVWARGRRGAGFTLIEILIALVIVSIGLMGILALLTSSLRGAGEVVEDTVAATVARSVYESLREGTRKRAFILRDGTRYVRGFVFLHDGVKEKGGGTVPPVVPTRLDDAVALSTLRSSNFAVFLPEKKPGGVTGSGSTAEQVFVYPRPDAGGDPTAENTNSTSDFLDTPQLGYAGQKIYLKVERVYELLNHNGKRISVTDSGEQVYLDANEQYSFAFAITRAPSPELVDASGKQLPWFTDSNNPKTFDSTKFPPRMAATSMADSCKDGLYQVEVMVFRNFDKNYNSRTHEPVPGGRFNGLLAIGP